MKIGVAGKGGTGKTTTSGTLARSLAALGHRVLAIDCDSSPNLGPTLGIDPGEFDSGTNLGHDVLEHVDIDGETWLKLALSVDEILDQYAMTAPDGIKLLTMARATEPGGG